MAAPLGTPRSARVPAFDDYWAQQSDGSRRAAIDRLELLGAELAATGRAGSALDIPRLLIRYVAAACTDPDLIIALRSPYAMGRPVLTEREFFSSRNPVFRLLDEHVVAAIAGGELSGDHHWVATTLLALAHGLALISIGGDRAPTDVGEPRLDLAQAVVGAAINGLRRGPNG